MQNPYFKFQTNKQTNNKKATNPDLEPTNKCIPVPDLLVKSMPKAKLQMQSIKIEAPDTLSVPDRPLISSPPLHHQLEPSRWRRRRGGVGEGRREAWSNAAVNLDDETGATRVWTREHGGWRVDGGQRFGMLSGFPALCWPVGHRRFIYCCGKKARGWISFHI